MSDITAIWQEFDLGYTNFCQYAGECLYRDTVEAAGNSRRDLCGFCQYKSLIDIPKVLSRRQGITFSPDEVIEKETRKYWMTESEISVILCKGCTSLCF